MFRNTLTALAAAALAGIALVSVTFAATGRAPLLQPSVIDIAKDVPLDVVFALPQADGSVITVTAPVTVGLNVQVSVQGPQVVDVKAAAQPATAAPVTGKADAAAKPSTAKPSTAGKLTDARGIPYTVQVPDGMEVLQVAWKPSLGAMLQIVGQIKNTGDKPFEFITVSVSLFDKDGQLLDVGSGAAQAQTLAPGKTTTFTALASVDAKEVASYAVQVESMR